MSLNSFFKNFSKLLLLSWFIPKSSPCFQSFHPFRFDPMFLRFSSEIPQRKCLKESYHLPMGLIVEQHTWFLDQFYCHWLMIDASIMTSWMSFQSNLTNELSFLMTGFYSKIMMCSFYHGVASNQPLGLVFLSIRDLKSFCLHQLMSCSELSLIYDTLDLKNFEDLPKFVPSFFIFISQ